jgi:hypothetical protein
MVMLEKKLHKLLFLSFHGFVYFVLLCCGITPTLMIFGEQELQKMFKGKKKEIRKGELTDCSELLHLTFLNTGKLVFCIVSVSVFDFKKINR